METAEEIYAKIEAAYSGTAWHGSRRQFGIRKNEVRRKQVNRDYLRQVLNKWSMGYGERPLYVLGVAVVLGLLTTFMLPLFGVQVQGTPIRYGLPTDFTESSGYYFALLKYTFYTLVGTDPGDVTTTGGGSAIEFGLTIAGQLLFAMFVYTLGRRAAA
ncbi:hypothetical protein [Natrinema sp. SYSU A 869]|uniref:hypothetical protein n=1 Tax=Natrinema sp. SYSU A 869 TaxID=2871694 RepID=UPI001CA4428A|nr:hypothetical protein [Natrinema sp. SYSU A 869]